MKINKFKFRSQQKKKIDEKSFAKLGKLMITGHESDLKASLGKLGKSMGTNFGNLEFLKNCPPETFENKQQNRFIQYRDGRFYCKGKFIDFPDEAAHYVLLVKALYLRSDSRGFASYETIDEFITEATKDKILGKQEKEKRILNALAGLYRGRKRQHNAFPKETRIGGTVIKNIPGKGFIFSNPIME